MFLLYQKIALTDVQYKYIPGKLSLHTYILWLPMLMDHCSATWNIIEPSDFYSAKMNTIDYLLFCHIKWYLQTWLNWEKWSVVYIHIYISNFPQRYGGSDLIITDRFVKYDNLFLMKMCSKNTFSYGGSKFIPCII